MLSHIAGRGRQRAAGVPCRPAARLHRPQGQTRPTPIYQTKSQQVRALSTRPTAFVRRSFFATPPRLSLASPKQTALALVTTHSNTFFSKKEDKQIDEAPPEELLPDAPAPPRPEVDTDLKVDPNSPEVKFFKYFIPYVSPDRVEKSDSPQLAQIRMQQEVLYRSRQITRTGITRILSLIFTSKAQERVLTATALYWLCRDQAERSEWASFGLPTTFFVWFNKILLHIWMMINRLRMLESRRDTKKIAQTMIDLLFEDIEDGIIRVGKTSNPLIIGKNRKYFLKFYHGACMGYDEGFWTSDAMLADALYRNFFVMEYQPGTAVKLEKMVAYVRREMSKLDEMTDEDVMRGRVRWGSPPTPAPSPTARVN